MCATRLIVLCALCLATFFAVADADGDAVQQSGQTAGSLKMDSLAGSLKEGTQLAQHNRVGHVVGKTKKDFSASSEVLLEDGTSTRVEEDNIALPADDKQATIEKDDDDDDDEKSDKVTTDDEVEAEKADTKADDEKVDETEKEADEETEADADEETEVEADEDDEKKDEAEEKEKDETDKEKEKDDAEEDEDKEKEEDDEKKEKTAKSSDTEKKEKETDDEESEDDKEDTAREEARQRRRIVIIGASVSAILLVFPIIFCFVCGCYDITCCFGRRRQTKEFELEDGYKLDVRGSDLHAHVYARSEASRSSRVSRTPRTTASEYSYSSSAYTDSASGERVSYNPQQLFRHSEHASEPQNRPSQRLNPSILQRFGN